MLELPEIQYGVDPEELYGGELTSADHQAALDLLMKLKPPRQGLTGDEGEFAVDEEETKLPIVNFHGLRSAYPTLKRIPSTRNTSSLFGKRCRSVTTKRSSQASR